MSEKTEILSPERLAEIGRQLEVPRARNSYVTDYGVAADVVEELYDHAAAFRQMVAAELAKLISPGLSQVDSDLLRGADLERKLQNRLIEQAATCLGLDLPAPTSHTS